MHTAGESALVEERTMLTPDREDGAAESEREPTAADIHPLLQSSHDAGLVIDATVDPRLSDCSPGLQVCAFRIIEEELTNTVRHTSARRATVRAVVRGSRVIINISDDDGPGPSDRPRDGRRLIGMQERVASYGGELYVSSGPRQGFAIHVTFDGAETTPPETETPQDHSTSDHPLPTCGNALIKRIP